VNVIAGEAEPVGVPVPVPGPGVGETGEGLLVQPAKAMAPQRSTRKITEILECMVKNASPSYIMLVLSQRV
jgi:hypothetical protein